MYWLRIWYWNRCCVLFLYAVSVLKCSRSFNSIISSVLRHQNAALLPCCPGNFDYEI